MSLDSITLQLSLLLSDYRICCWKQKNCWYRMTQTEEWPTLNWFIFKIRGMHTTVYFRIYFTISYQNCLTNLPHGAESFLRRRQSLSYSRISKHFMEPEGSLPSSHEPSAGLYPEPDTSNSYRPILSLGSVLILSSNICLGLLSDLLLSGFPTKILYAFLFAPFVLHALHISSSLTWSF
jgi:hypothetical protein